MGGFCFVGDYSNGKEDRFKIGYFGVRISSRLPWSAGEVLNANGCNPFIHPLKSDADLQVFA